MDEETGRGIGERGPDGRFLPGHPGGPGRPRRPTEASYLRVLSESCPPETWARICERAVEDALAGDGKARSWLAQFIMGKEPPALLDLVADERDGYGEEQEIEDRRRRRAQERMLAAVTGDLFPDVQAGGE